MRTTITELNLNSMNARWDSFKKWTVILAVVGILVSAIVTIFSEDFRGWLKREKRTEYSIAGRVVDDLTGTSIAGAVVTIVGRTEAVRSESNGNFTLKIKGDPNRPEPVRLEASRAGYQNWDQEVVPPQSAMMISLKRE